MTDQSAKILNSYTISVEQAAEVLGIAANSAYRAVKNGDIPSIQIGGVIRVLTVPLREMLGLPSIELTSPADRKRPGRRKQKEKPPVGLGSPATGG